MKRFFACVLVTLTMLALLVSCKGTEQPKMPEGKQYVWENAGFGGEFTLLLLDDGTYQYSPGPLSSYIGLGNWKEENGIVILKESTGYDWTFRFRRDGKNLTYVKEGSDAFMHVDVKDGAKFFYTGIINSSVTEQCPDYASENARDSLIFLSTLKSAGYVQDGEVRKDFNTNGIERVRNITPESISKETLDLQIFYVEPSQICFLMHKGTIYKYDTLGGRHEKLVLWDYDGNGEKDLVSLNTSGSGVTYKSVWVTDLKTMETKTVFSRKIPDEKNFHFLFDGINIYIDGNVLSWSDGSFHCGDLF